MIDIFFLSYFALLNVGYLALLFSAAVDLVWVRRGLAGLPPDHLWLRGQVTLPVSIIAPAFDEEASVVESVRSLLHLRYPEHQVIVVNDGSTDRTLERLRDAFQLVEVPLDFRQELEAMPIRATYRSTTDERLLVIDKENGGKADALNAGVNASRFPLLCAIDADSILAPDALLRIVRVFISDPEVIAAGGSIRVANGCKIDMGHVLEVGLPKSLIARFQVVEYLRAFLLGRLGWERLGGNLIVSGAFGMFRRASVVAAGGYKRDTVGEDMELVVRLRKTLPADKQRRAIRFLPDPVCFTEVPESFSVLGRQRDRWQRGLAETLWRHRSMIFNPRYGAVGTFVIPFFVVFELFGPLIEIAGHVWFLTSLIAGTLDPVFAVCFFTSAMLIGFLLSLGGLLLEEQSFALYRNPKDIFKLVVAAFLDGFGYRQITLLYRIRGIWSYFRGSRAWGKMARLGFGGPRKTGSSFTGAPAIVAIAVAVALTLPVGWLAKPELSTRVVVFDKTVPFENYREHHWLLWLLSQNKVRTPDGGHVWQAHRDYVGYRPTSDTLDPLTPASLEGADLLYIADTYGVYAEDIAGRSTRTAALDRSNRLEGGLSASEMSTIEGFGAKGGRIVAEFNTFASPTEPDVRRRLESVLGVRWLGWVGRSFRDLSDTSEVPPWAHRNFEKQYGRSWTFEGPGLLMVRDDDHIVVLSGERDLSGAPVLLQSPSTRDIPYGYWFDMVEPAAGRNVLATFSIHPTESGAKILTRERIPTVFPAVVSTPDLSRVYLAGDFADGESALGPPWLAGVPSVRRALSKAGFLPDELQTLWIFYAPFIESLLQPRGAPPK